MMHLSSRFKFAAALVVLGLAAPVWGQSIKTPAEESGWTRYSQYEDVTRFLQAIDQASKEATVQVIGKTLDAKELAAANLYLCIINKEGVDSPKALNRKRPTVLIVASQHGNEQSGKEAALRLIRDLTAGDLKGMLDKANFLLIPQANPYGNMVNRRTNEQDLDLNRDHVKLESPETRAIHKVIRAWMPEVTLDLHEKGDDYYRVSTGCVSNFNINPAQERYSREKIFPAIEKKVTADGFTWHEYLVSEAIGSTQSAGVPDRQGRGGPPREIAMRPSTTDLNDGRNSPGIYDTLSFIQECSSRHDVPTLQERTNWQYSGIRGLIDEIARDNRHVLTLVLEKRADLLRNARKPSPAQVVHLKMEYVRDPKQPELTLKAFERQPGAPGNAPATANVNTQIVKNWMPKVESRLSVPRPLCYVIPASHQAVIKTLLDHGIAVEVISKDGTIEAESYQIQDIVPAKDDYVAPSKIEVVKQSGKIPVHKGDFCISVAQPAANLITCLLEPQSEYGLIRYQSYNLVPQKGSVFPIVRITKGKPQTAPYVQAQ
jgi:hypothetical protein